MGLSMLSPKESEASAGYSQMPSQGSMGHGCCCEALPPLSVRSKVIVLVPAVVRLFKPEDIWPARVHGKLLGTKTEVTGARGSSCAGPEAKIQTGKINLLPASWCQLAQNNMYLSYYPHC